MSQTGLKSQGFSNELGDGHVFRIMTSQIAQMGEKTNFGLVVAVLSMLFILGACSGDTDKRHEIARHHLSDSFDILFVVDNTAGCIAKQRLMGESFQIFASRLEVHIGKDYQIGVVTTGMETINCPPCSSLPEPGATCVNESGESGRLQERIGYNRGSDDDPDTVTVLRDMGYTKPSTVIEIVRGWHHGRYAAVRSPRSRERLTEVQPFLIEALADTADPDAAITAFDRFVSDLPAGIQLFSLLRANPNLLRLVADIMGTAPRLARILSRRRRLLDVPGVVRAPTQALEALGLARGAYAQARLPDPLALARLKRPEAVDHPAEQRAVLVCVAPSDEPGDQVDRAAVGDPGEVQV